MTSTGLPFKRISLIVALIGLIALCLGFGLSTQPKLSEAADLMRLAGLGVAALGGAGLLVASGPSLYGFSRTRRARYGANSLILTLSCLGVIGLLNYLVLRHDIKWDVTENQTFTISPLTEKILAHLKKEVKVKAFFSVTSRDRQVVLNRLETYRDKSGGKLSFEMIDPERQPGIGYQYGIKSSGSMVFESGTQRKLILSTDEEQLTSGVLSVTEPLPHVYFLTGHNELDPENFDQHSGLSALKVQLEQLNFVVTKLSLPQTGKVPDDASVLVIPGPDRRLAAEEVKAIETYLQQRHGKLLLLLPPKVTTGLEPLLKSYGIQIGDNILADPNSNFQQELTTPMFTVFTDHPITDGFNGQLAVLLPLARSIGLGSPPAQVKGTELMKTTPASWGESNLQANSLVKKESGDRPGPLSAAVALTVSDAKAPVAEGSRSSQTRIVVVGNAAFANNWYMRYSANGNFFLNSVAWLDDANNLIAIRPKPTTDRTLILSGAQQTLIAYLSIGIVPGLVALLGLLIWWRRR